jgi:GntR family transcriptional regulator / MocR family aminotransferase
MKRAALVGIPPLTLDRRRPLSKQIAAGIRAAIQTGRIGVGDRLPASRTLARAIGVARQVVVAAYEDLAASGHLAGRTGAGSYVAIETRPAMAQPIRLLRDPDGRPIQILLLA